MEVNLYRLSRVSWAVQANGMEAEVFSTIEDASSYMMTLGVKDDAIDNALIEMSGNSHTRANFGIYGTFIFTDGARHNGLLGVA